MEWIQKHPEDRFRRAMSMKDMDMGDDIEGADAGAEGREMKETVESEKAQQGAQMGGGPQTIKEAQVEGKVNKAVSKEGF